MRQRFPAIATLCGALVLCGGSAPHALAAKATKAPTLGPKPCKDGPGGWGDNGCMPNTWIAEFSVSPEVIRLGETLNFSVALTGAKSVNWQLTYFEGTVKSGCGSTDTSCVVEPTTASATWQKKYFNATADIGTGTEEVAYAVINDYLLEGHVRDPDDKGVAGVRVNIAGKSGKLKGQRYYAETDSDGYYSALLNKGKADVSVARLGGSPKKRGVTLKGGGAATADFRVIDPKLTVVARSGSRVAVNREPWSIIDYSGEGWDPDGGPIGLLFDGKRVASAAGKSFASSYNLSIPYPNHTCTAEFTAKQGEIERSATIEGERSDLVVYAEDVRASGAGRFAAAARSNKGRELKRRSFLCDGEWFKAGPDGSIVMASLIGKPKTGYDGMYLYSRPRSIEIGGDVRAGDIRMRVGGNKHIRLRARPYDVGKYDPAGQVGTVNLDGAHEKDLWLAGRNRASGNFRAKKAVKLDGALLYVDGDIKIDGGLTGVGLVAATGDISVKGPIELRPDNVVPLAAGKRLLLYGADRCSHCGK